MDHQTQTLDLVCRTLAASGWIVQLTTATDDAPPTLLVHRDAHDHLGLQLLLHDRHRITVCTHTSTAEPHVLGELADADDLVRLLQRADAATAASNRRSRPSLLDPS